MMQQQRRGVVQKHRKGLGDTKTQPVAYVPKLDIKGPTNYRTTVTSTVNNTYDKTYKVLKEEHGVYHE